MFLKKWNDLPQFMRNDSVREYYALLNNKRVTLIAKRLFDLCFAIIAIIVLSPIFIILGIAIKVDSKGPVMFRQLRVTQYGRRFKIYKFRTMVKDAESRGTQVTTKDDQRVTKIGFFLRKTRLDEIPQLINIIIGDMSFVGTRPEVVKYVDQYTDVMLATLLLPAGVTSEASIQYKDEEKLLANNKDVDMTYINEVLPEKMNFNLRSIENFGILNEIRTIVKTVIAVIPKGK